MPLIKATKGIDSDPIRLLSLYSSLKNSSLKVDPLPDSAIANQ